MAESFRFLSQKEYDALSLDDRAAYLNEAAAHLARVSAKAPPPPPVQQQQQQQPQQEQQQQAPDQGASSPPADKAE